MNRGIGIVTTKYGKVQGTVENGISRFMGIPFAKPPVGDLRWKAPEKPEPYEGVRICDKGAAISWQLPGNVGVIALRTYPMSEDCLYLNIWTPAQSAGEKLPVLFWIHGGAFIGGVGAEGLYDGSYLASKGIIVVSITYRLGALGFMATPELSAENPEGVSGNYGLLDMIAALEWVKENISQFGGDPKKITIDGQSAGGMAVCQLLTSPRTAGLFSGAIIQSGGPHLNRQSLILADAEKMGVEFMKAAGCANLEEMRALSPEKILEVVKEVHGPGSMRQFQPLVDGVILPEPPIAAFLGNRIAQVPIMYGSTWDEGFFGPRGATEEEYDAFIRDFAGEDYEALTALYGVKDGQYGDQKGKIGRDVGFASLRLVAHQLEGRRCVPFYHYCFAQYRDREDGGTEVAYHASDLFYMFHTLEQEGESTLEDTPWKPILTRDHYNVSEAMSCYWAGFVRQGDPNVPGQPDWPACSKAEDKYMRFENGKAFSTGPDDPEKTALLTRLLLKQAKEQGLIR